MLPVIGPLASRAVAAPAAAAPASAASFGDVLRRAAATAPSPPAARPSDATLAALASRSLHALQASSVRLDRELGAARRGGLDAAELLTVQAHAHAHARAVELAARVAESAAQSVRQAVQSNV